MSTTHSTFKRGPLSYTVLGRTGFPEKKPEFSLLLLSRCQESLQEKLFDELFNWGVEEILAVGMNRESSDIARLTTRYARLSFILVQGSPTFGEMINLGISETRGRYVAVIQDQVRMRSPLDALSLGEIPESSMCLCWVPSLETAKGDTIPYCRVPSFRKNQLEVIPMRPAPVEVPTLYPFDFCGLYHRKKFHQIGGFDDRLLNPYWQRLDFGFRAFMWGETISTTPRLRWAYTGEVPQEETTPDSSSFYFYLKTLAVRVHHEKGQLGLRQFFRYWIRMGGDLFETYRDFCEVGRWVQENKSRFKMSAQEVAKRWSLP